LRASKAPWGKSMVRLEAFFGSLNESAAFPYALQLAVHLKRPRIEVDVRPLQAKDLALPQTRYKT
jgi:hypothetical protein